MMRPASGPAQSRREIQNPNPVEGARLGCWVRHSRAVMFCGVQFGGGFCFALLMNHESSARDATSLPRLPVVTCRKMRVLQNVQRRGHPTGRSSALRRDRDDLIACMVHQPGAKSFIEGVFVLAEHQIIGESGICQDFRDTGLHEESVAMRRRRKYQHDMTVPAGIDAGRMPESGLMIAFSFKYMAAVGPHGEGMLVE